MLILKFLSFEKIALSLKGKLIKIKINYITFIGHDLSVLF